MALYDEGMSNFTRSAALKYANRAYDALEEVVLRLDEENSALTDAARSVKRDVVALILKLGGTHPG